MREILFRGRQTDKDRWVYGVPVNGTSVDESEILIVESVFNCEEYCCRGCEFSPVIPETVGQYTGLTDKNGTKIFEGDIVKTSHWNGFIEWNDFDASFVVHCVGTFVTQNTLAGHATLEVIGNIHDNPELLEGGD